jgi:hypothetical protein
MKLYTKIVSANSPIRFAPMNTSHNNETEDHIVAIKQHDAKKFINDIAALFQSKIVDMRDRLIGVKFEEDRVIYFGKRREWIEKLECNRSVPFAIELIRNENKVWLNKIPVGEVKSIAGKTIFGLTYGDTEVEYMFATHNL